MWFVYILESKEFGKYYIGCTDNIERRLSEHNSGKTISIRKYIPYELIYFEKFEKQNNAFNREKQIKKYKGGKAFKKLIEKI